MKLKLLIIVIIWPCILMAYPWPMHDGMGGFNGPLNVSAALGDYRNTYGTSPRFHNGVDISEGAGTAVFSIESGVSVYPSGDPGVRTVGGNYAYVHLSNRIPENRNITGILENPNNPTQIGTVQTNHLHFIDGPGGGPYRNPFFGLDNYADNNNPNIRDEIFFYQSGPELLSAGNRQQLAENLYGKIDIRAHINDQLNTGITGGIYGATYEIQNTGGGVLYDPNTSVFFSQVSPPNDGEPVKYVYDITISQHATSSTFRYWVSNAFVNDAVEDRYCNTKLKRGEAWNGRDAYINSEAQIPDGRIRVQIEAWDMSTGNSTRIAERHVDNFTPYIQELILKQNSVAKYQANWPGTPASATDLGELRKTVNDTIDRGKDLAFELVFSEDMNTAAIPSVMLKLSNGTNAPLPVGQWTDARHFTATASTSLIPDGYKGVATIQISGTKDLANNLLDSDPKSIAGRDANGAWQRYTAGTDANHKFKIGDVGFQVDATNPKTGDKNVAINKQIKITFSKPVDPTTFTTSTVTFDPALNGSFTTSWNSSQTEATLSLTDSLNDFKYNQKYTITLSDSIKDTSHVNLDGDGDGNPKGKYKFQFTTRKPAFKYPDETVLFGPQPQTKLVKALLTNKEKRTLKYKVTGPTGSGNGKWRFELIDFSGEPPVREVILDSLKTDTIKVNLTHLVSGGDKYILNFTAKAYDPDDDRYLDTLVNQKIMAVSADTGSRRPPGRNGPGMDVGTMRSGPDDNWSISDPSYSTPWLIDDKSQAGLLLSGYYGDMGHLLGMYGMATVPVEDESLMVFSEQYDELDSLKTLIIPSGGLRDKEYNSYFWQKLNSYVSNGGNLLVMDQPFGSLYSRLPGSPQARGWEEDLSCTGWFTRMGDWHPVMSGQRWLMNNYPSDGYFTYLPYNAQIITRRVKRGGAASTVIYPYGQGTVAMTTCYTDFGTGRGQWHQEGGHLIRDLVTCGLDPNAAESLRHYGSQDTVDLNVPIKYNQPAGSVSANKAVVTVLNPYRNEYRRQEIDLFPALQPGDSTTVNWSGWALPQLNELGLDSNRGAWQVNYALYNDTTVMQDEKTAQMFITTAPLRPIGRWNDSINPYFAAMYSSRPLYVLGDTVPFRIDVGNNTQDTAEIYLKIKMSSSYGQKYDSTAPFTLLPDSIISLDWPYFADANGVLFITELCRSADHEVLFQAPYDYRTFDNPMIVPSAGITVGSAWTQDRFVKLDFSVKSNYAGRCSLDYVVMRNNTGDTLARRTLDFVFGPDNAWHGRDSVIIDSTWALGYYRAAGRCYRPIDTVSPLNQTSFGYWNGYFQLQPAKLAAHIVDDSLMAWADTAKIAVSITPANRAMKNAVLDYSLSARGHQVFHENRLLDSLTSGDTLLIPYSLAQQDRKFGTYDARFKLAYAEDSISGTKNTYLSPRIEFAFNKGWAAWGDTLSGAINIRNDSPCPLDSMPLVILQTSSAALQDTAAPFWADSSRLISLLPGSDTTINILHAVDTTETVGVHDYTCALLSHGTFSAAESRYEIQRPDILTACDDTLYSVGDTVRLIALNSGGCGVNLKTIGLQVSDPYGNSTTLANANVYLAPGQAAVLCEYRIIQSASGRYQFFWYDDLSNGGETWRDVQCVATSVNGYDAAIGLATSRDLYFPADSIRPQADVTNRGAMPLDHRLDLTISSYGIKPIDTTYIPDTEYWPEPWTGGNSLGCKLISGSVELTGRDSLYPVSGSNWSIELARSKDGVIVRSVGDLVRRAFRNRLAKNRSNKGAETIRSIDLAAAGDGLRLLVSTDQRNLVYSDFPEPYNPAVLPVSGLISDIAVSTGSYFLASTDSSRIYRVGKTTNMIERYWPVASLRGIVCANGNVYAVTASGDAVISYSEDGDSLASFGYGILSQPADIAAGGNGTFYVSDSLGVALFDNAGAFLGRRAPGRIGRIVVDAKGYLYCKNLDSSRVMKYDETGAYVEQIYQWPFALAACTDTLQVAVIQSGSQGDMVHGDAYENLGRNRGYTTIKAGTINGLRAITRFAPETTLNGGTVDHRFWIEVGYKKHTEDFRTYWPIDSLTGFNFRRFHDYGQLGFDATLKRPDGALSSAYHSLSLTKQVLSPGDPVWQDSIHVTLASGGNVLSGLNAGVMPDSGQFMLQGAMELMPGQPVPGIAPHLFEVWGSPLAVTLTPDQTVYVHNETARILSVVHNRTDSTITNLQFTAFKAEQTLLDTTILSFAPHAVCSLMLTCTDDNAVIIGTRTTADLVNPVERYVLLEFNEPLVDYYYWEANFPDTVDCRPFTINGLFHNNWSRDVILHPVYSTSRDTITDSLFLRQGQSGTASATFCISQDETVCLVVPELDELWLVDRRQIVLGTKAHLKTDTITTSGTGKAYFDYRLMSTGGWQETYRLALALRDTNGTMIDSSDIRYSLAGHDSVPGRWTVAPGIGRYRIDWQVSIDSVGAVVDTGSQAMTIAPPNTMAIDSILIDPLCNADGSVAVQLYATNGSAEPFDGSFRFESAVGYGRKDTVCGGLQSLAMQFTLPEAIDPGRHLFHAYAISCGDTVDFVTSNLSFAPRLVIDTMPSNMAVATGDTVPFAVRVKNTGNAVSYDTLAYDLGELCDARIALRVNPASLFTDTTIIIVPEDLEDQTVLGSVATPGERSPVRIKIDGYKIAVSAQLNQEMYCAGDSIRLTLTTTPANERPLFCRNTAIYQGQEQVSRSYLSGYARDVSLSDPGRITATGDTAVYVSKLVDCGPFDSATVRTEPVGTALSRNVLTDSTGTGTWTGLLSAGRLCQYKLALAPFDTVDRVVISRFISGAQLDTIIDVFDSLHVRTTATWAFDPGQGPQANLFYGVYANTGRGLWLNTAYIYKQNDSLTIIPDKQVYQPGDTVKMLVHTALSGEMQYSSVVTMTDTVNSTMSLSGADTVLWFIAPSELVAGCRYLSYRLNIGGDTAQAVTGAVQFDINGYLLRLHECRLSRTVYGRGDTVKAYVKLNSSHAYDLGVIANLRLLVSGSESKRDTSIVPLISGYNWFEIKQVIPADFSRGPAALDLRFSKGQLALGGHEARFEILVPDTLPPSAIFLQCPANTYESQLPYIVTVRCRDSSGVADTLYYNAGYGWSAMAPGASEAGVSEYDIPGQPRGTTVSYYVSACDEFGNRARAPQEGFMAFHVLPALPPGDVTADTSALGVDLSWQPPQQEIVYHRYSPEASSGYPAAILVSAPYYPARLDCVSLWDSGQDTSTVQLGFYAPDSAQLPGVAIHPAVHLRDSDTSAGWKTWSLDTSGIEITGDLYLGFARPGSSLWGDGAPDAFRTVIYRDGIWRTDPAFGNILAHSSWSYPAQPVLYQVQRAVDGSVYGLIADSLMVLNYRDTAIAPEGRYRYSVKALWTAPALYAASYPLALSVDYLAPRIDDSLQIVFTDSTVAIGAAISDGIGVSADSIHPETLPAAICDSIIEGVHWYHLPGTVKNDTLRFYLTAADSAGNIARSPQAGWHQVVYTGVAAGPIQKIPTCFGLGNAYPNPNAGRCNIRYQLPKACAVDLALYNLAGQQVRKLDQGLRQPGYYQAQWDGRDANGRFTATGIYFYRLVTGEYVKTKKVMVIR